MPVRIHYVRTELSEGEVEVLREVDAYEIMEDNTVKLQQYVEDSGRRRRRTIGYIHRDRWQSVLTLEPNEAEVHRDR